MKIISWKLKKKKRLIERRENTTYFIGVTKANFVSVRVKQTKK